jgi:hypothetical protein
MKSSVFWDITPCNAVKVNHRFGGRYRLHLKGLKVSQARNQHEVGSKEIKQALLLQRVSPKSRLTFIGLHGVISQKMEFFFQSQAPLM